MTSFLLTAEAERVESGNGASLCNIHIAEDLALNHLASRIAQFHGQVSHTRLPKIEDHGMYHVIGTIYCVHIITRRPDTVEYHLVCMESELRYIIWIHQRFLICEHIGT